MTATKSSEFGITLSCFQGDYPFVTGCCASIRAYQKDVPICLIADGAFAADDLKAQYGVTVLYPDDVNPRLRVSCGYGLTKMIAFWHSPFERFMHIDSDTIWWGDILRGLPWRDYDFIYNEPHEIITPEIQKSQYFDPDKLFGHVPEFPWKGKPYFNTGCFVARRGILDLDEYLRLLELQQEQRDIFISGEQGILNYMIFSRVARGEITALSWPLQAVVPVIADRDLRSRFQFRQGQPVLNDSDRRVIHWAGPKPYLVNNKSVFLDPMVHYRMVYLQDSNSALKTLGRLGLMFEEIRALSYRYRHKIRVGAIHYGSVWQYLRFKSVAVAKRILSRFLPPVQQSSSE
jgi:hypothetical protein